MEKVKEKKYSVFSNYQYIYRELWNYDKKLIAFSLAEVLLHVMAAIGAIWMPAMIIRMLEQKTDFWTMLGSILCGFVIFGLICGGKAYLTHRNLFQYINFRSGYIMKKMIDKTIHMDYALYEAEENQKLYHKGHESFRGTTFGLEGILHNDVRILICLLNVTLYALMMTEVSYAIIGMLVLISLLQVMSFRLANRYEMGNKDKKAKIRITQSYLDTQAYHISAGKDIRLYQLQGWLSNVYQKANKKYQALLLKEKCAYFSNDLFGLLLQLGRDAVCYGYLLKSLQNGMPVSQFVFYLGMVSGFSVYFSEITNKVTENGRNHKSISFFRQYLDIGQIFRHGSGKAVSSDAPAIEVEFSHVSFSYSGSSNKTLDDISFTIKKGEKMALVGINGAGKTTIVKLICGFYQPQEGHIYINGIDMADLDLEKYYKELAVVFQDAFTFSFTIADNVSCCIKEAYSKEKCLEALKRAGLWDKVEELPAQEETFLNKDVRQDGIQLSGGQLQKLLLARALYKECKLLLLDEPTKALDAMAENEMYEKYSQLISDKTALFISHRLASTRFCDKILLLENGKIMEEGSHEELMEYKGKYAHMFEVQSQYYKDGRDQNETETALA